MKTFKHTTLSTAIAAAILGVATLAPAGGIRVATGDIDGDGVRGEKGNTQDINIGVGELQECSLLETLTEEELHFAVATGQIPPQAINGGLNRDIIRRTTGK